MIDDHAFCYSKKVMEYTAEIKFVNSFITKSRRERLLFELAHAHKRDQGLNRFCHQSKELLDQKKIFAEGYDLEQLDEFRDFVESHEDICYVVSPDFRLDEKFMPLKEAVEKALMCMDAVLIIGNEYAVVFGEAMKGGRDKFLLYDQK